VWTGYVDSLIMVLAKPNGPKPESVQLEFISANPTGPCSLMLGQAIAGDIPPITYTPRLRTFLREYYLNDGEIRLLSLLQRKAVQIAKARSLKTHFAPNSFEVKGLLDKRLPIEEVKIQRA